MGAPDWVDVFPIKNGDIPASYVNLPEGTIHGGNHHWNNSLGSFRYAPALYITTLDSSGGKGRPHPEHTSPNVLEICCAEISSSQTKTWQFCDDHTNAPSLEYWYPKLPGELERYIYIYKHDRKNGVVFSQKDQITTQFRMQRTPPQSLEHSCFLSGLGGLDRLV